MNNSFKNRNDYFLDLQENSSKFNLKYSKFELQKFNKENNIQTMIKVIYNLFYDDKEEEKFKDSIFEKKFGEVKKKE